MTNEEEADAAIAELHHSEFEGTNIRVQRSSRGRDDEVGIFLEHFGARTKLPPFCSHSMSMWNSSPNFFASPGS